MNEGVNFLKGGNRRRGGNIQMKKKGRIERGKKITE
jgi:hypothetical protein